MIKVDKGETPEYLKSDEVLLAIERMKEFYNRKDREQRRYNFPFDKEILGKLKPILHERFHGKCGYCEIKIPSPEYGTVDRFRPHNGVRDNKEYFKDLYWWLAYDWDNLIYSCRECNQYKANYFPLKDEKTRVIKKEEDLKSEQFLLINPCVDDTTKHILSDYGTIDGIDEKGHQTNDLLRLNRIDLLNKRVKAVEEMKRVIKKAESEFKSISNIEIEFLVKISNGSPEIEFLFALQQSFIRTVSENLLINLNLKGMSDSQLFIENKKILNLKNLIHVNIEHSIVNYYFPIEYIKIKNFKNIADFELRVPEGVDGQEAWVFILGENGVGKTSLLQAIAIGLMPTYKTGEKIVSQLIRKGEKKAIIEIKEKNRNNIVRTELIKNGNKIISKGEYMSFILGYGTFRMMKQEGFSPEISIGVRYKNLFEPKYSLNDVISWLKNIYDYEPKKFEIVATSLLKLLPNNTDDLKIIKNNNNIVLNNKPDIPINEYSEGYKTVISMAVDMMITLSEANADMDKLTGIVLIDEIGNQLHPRWQMKIVKKMREVFPLIQFIVSSHNPLCLRGIKKGEVIILKENEKGEILADTNLPSPEEYTIEQLLKSDFFGLHSTFDEDEEIEYKVYYDLLLKQEKEKLTEEETLMLRNLKLKFQPKENHLGTSLREELMFEVIDKLLAAHYNNTENKLSREDLKAKTLELVKQAWENID